MESWKLFLVFSLTVFAVACLEREEPAPRPEIVCHVSIYPDISGAILEKVEDCDHVIVCYDGLCDLAKHLLNFADARRVALIRSRAPQAKILRQVEIQFDENFDPNLAVQNVEASLVGGLFDGVELAIDSAQLDHHGQIKYAQFFKQLKRNVDDHLLISTSFICNQHLPAFLLNAMSEALDYVILVPASQNASIAGSALEPRVYSGSVANCLLSANFPRNKIVLGLPTGGKLVDSSVDRKTPSNFIPYGNVCELHEEQQQHCEKLQNQDCSLFEDGVKLIYDDPNSAGRRALQCVGCKLRGVSVALSYDDPAGICVGSSFPLLSAVQNVFKYRSGVMGFHGCPPEYEESEGFDNEEHDYDISSHSLDYIHGDSDKRAGCSCVHGELCSRCHLRKRLLGTLKSSESIASISEDVTKKVLGSLDRVVSLVSLMLHYRSKNPLVTRIPPLLEHVGPPVIQPDENLSFSPSSNSGLSEEFGQNALTGEDSVQSYEGNPDSQPEPAGEVDPILQSGFGKIQPEEFDPVPQPGPSSAQTIGVDSMQQSEFYPKQTDEVDPKSSSVSDQVHEVDPILQPGHHPNLTNEENHESPSVQVSEQTFEENQNSSSNLDLQTAEENQNLPTDPPPRPYPDQLDEETLETDQGSENTSSGPDTE